MQDKISGFVKLFLQEHKPISMKQLTNNKEPKFCWWPWLFQEFREERWTLSQSCHPTISSSVVPFSSCLQSFPVSGSFQMSQLFASGGHSFSISPYNEYSGLISYRINWFDLLAVQTTLKSLLQHHSSKASVLWCSAFFMVQLSHPYMTTGKATAVTGQTFVSKVMSLLIRINYFLLCLP